MESKEIKIDWDNLQNETVIDLEDKYNQLKNNVIPTFNGVMEQLDAIVNIFGYINRHNEYFFENPYCIRLEEIFDHTDTIRDIINFYEWKLSEIDKELDRRKENNNGK